eukprot:TRINITY_DN11229_c0_g1_i1.p1 TRINITY_DN11229_c0_g1~~TRINITY_DN11229_c0_g1_i1.p1  ORF type:complete len:616 (+),score=152.61 TRINITY_DN11229_c0_g1_i1:46-1893(+)
MMLRIQTKNGIQRTKVDFNQTIYELKQSLLQSVQNATESELMYRETNGVVKKLEDNQKLSSYNLRNGDLLLLQENNTGEQNNQSEKETVQTMKIDKNGQLVKVVDDKVVVEEDEIDQQLRKIDGWTTRKGASSSYRTPDDYVAPWSIQVHSPWKEYNIKHLPFHSWIKEKLYKASSGTKLSLDEPTFRLKNRGQVTGPEILRSSVTLNRQPYRHVDFIMFEDRSVVDPFIEAWRKTGHQRCGYLIGRYEPYERIPLGIAAKVCAIYEPKQKSTKSSSLLLLDNDAEAVDNLLAKLGLKRVGFIWTSLHVDENKKVIADRDPTSPLETSEMMRMANLQARYRSPWSESSSGYFGSKFVSVLLCGAKDNGVDIEGYQMSNQGVALTNEKVIKRSKENPKEFRVSRSNEEWLYPDIMFSDKDEYGNTVIRKVDSELPSNFFIINVTHGFPNNVDPDKFTFKTSTFPAENRPDRPVTWDDVKKKIGAVGTSSNAKADFARVLSDFHLLIFLATHELKDPSLLDKIISFIKNDKSVSADEIFHGLKVEIEINLSSTSPSPVNSMSSPSQPKNTTPSSRSSLDPKIQTLVSAGFTVQQAEEALFACGGNVESAANFLLSSI